MKKIISVILATALMLSCSATALAIGVSNIKASNIQIMTVADRSGADNIEAKKLEITVANEFEVMLKSLEPTELVKDNAQCISENIHLVKKWVEDYEKGIAGSVAIYYDNGGFPSSIFIIESDGTQSYTITQYKQDTGERITLISSLVVERTLDYVFGADTDLTIPLIIHKQALDEASMKWNSSVNLGISSDAAEKIAKQAFIDILKYEELGKKLHGGGIYILNSEIKELDEPNFPKQYYRTTGAVRIANIPCYIVSMYTDEKEMNSAAQSGNIFAVSADGKICFIANVADVGWVLVEDTNETLKIQ